MLEITVGDYSLDPLARLVNPDGTELCIIRQPREADIWAMEAETKAMRKREEKFQTSLKRKMEVAREKAEAAGELPPIDKTIDEAEAPRDLSVAYLIAARLAVLTEPRVKADQLLEALPIAVANELHHEVLRIIAGGERKKATSPGD